jgi:hypothetical protein
MARYIDAEALKSQITRYHMSLTPRYISKLVDAEIGDIIDIVDEQPTIEARPVVRGEWIDGFFKDTVECSVCFEKGVCKCYETRHNFCPNCGADMRPKEESEDAGN